MSERSQSRRRIPILMYHQVTPRPSVEFARYTVTAKAFAAQMRWLSIAGYSAVSLDDMLSHRVAHRSLPRRPVVITFDDGFRDLLQHAVPVLERFGFTATFFLVTGLMGADARWLGGGIAASLPIMDWRAARELHARGFTCGAHSASHPRLTEVPSDLQREELVRSRRAIEDALGAPARHFAYPFGAFDSQVRALVEETGFSTACSTIKGISDDTDDLFALRRVSVYGHDSLLAFMCRVETARSARELLRERIGRSLLREGSAAGGRER